MKIALVYDRVNKWGGAERVLLALHDLFPDAPLYTSVYSPETAAWASVFPKVIPSFLQNFPLAAIHHELYALLMPIAFEQFNFDQYDLVISVTSEAAKGIITKPGTKHICYCLTPTRYLWSGYGAYFPNGLKRWIVQPAIRYLRGWDKVAAQRPDVLVAISKTVADRIKKYYGREVEVVYPPVSRLKNKQSLALRTKSEKLKVAIQNKNYFLIVSRLVPYKRVDLAIEAFNSLGLPLVVVGTGSEEGKLRRMAKSNIRFVGQLTDEELAQYYKEARALIFPQEEDFGIVALEAQSLGTPVVAYRAGGALETVIQGQTGEFFWPQTTEALVRAIKSFRKENYDENLVMKNAQKFSKERFKRELLKII